VKSFCLRRWRRVAHRDRASVERRLTMTRRPSSNQWRQLLNLLILIGAGKGWTVSPFRPAATAPPG